MIRVPMFSLLLLLLLTSAVCSYDMGDLPLWKQGDQIIAWALPPGAEIPETDQWPAAAWFEYNKVQFVIYAKHLPPVDPATSRARFTVWVSVPPQYKQEIEQDHPFGPADAYAYLRKAEISSMKPELYVGPGDRWAEAPGAETWTANTDRCVMGVFETQEGGIVPRAYALHRILWDGQPPGKNLGQMKCQCPKYDTGQAKPPTEEWIAWISRTQQDKRKVDQWGLPGNSPVPAPPEPEPPTPPTTPEKPEEGTEPPTAPSRDAGVGLWVDPTARTLTAIFPNGTWEMIHLAQEEAHPRAGNWGRVGTQLSLRTYLANAAQTWLEGTNPAWLGRLVDGSFDLTMIWDISPQGPHALQGSLHTWQVQFSGNGTVQDFQAWDAPDSEPQAITWQRAASIERLLAAPEQVISELQRLTATPIPSRSRTAIGALMARWQDH